MIKKKQDLILEVYRFWDDGEITWQEGTRSEHTTQGHGSIPGSSMYKNFKFVLKREVCDNIFTYIIGTEEECENLRKEMYRLVLLLTNTK